MTVDAHQARRLYRRACDSGLAIGCVNEAVLLVEKRLGEGADLEASDREASSLLQRACLQRSARGCERLANLVIEGRAGGMATEIAMAAHEAECDQGFGPACMRLSSLLSKAGRPAEAELRRQRACELGASCSPAR